MTYNLCQAALTTHDTKHKDLNKVNRAKKKQCKDFESGFDIVKAESRRNKTFGAAIRAIKITARDTFIFCRNISI